MWNKKLVRTERVIEVNELVSNNLIEEININHISLNQLLEIFEPYERGDPYLYDPYDINREQMEQLNKYLETPIIYNDNYDYTLACFGIYEDL